MAKRKAGGRRGASPAAALMAGFEAGRLGLEAQTVIGLRMMGWAGLRAMPAAENLRMVTEKQEAFARAAVEVAATVARGGGTIAAARAAMRPLHGRTAANVARLSRRAGA